MEILLESGHRRRGDGDRDRAGPVLRRALGPSLNLPHGSASRPGDRTHSPDRMLGPGSSGLSARANRPPEREWRPTPSGCLQVPPEAGGAPKRRPRQPLPATVRSVIEATGAAGFEPLLEHLEAPRWASTPASGGGWGIDVLAGRVSRPHHDTDLFLPMALSWRPAWSRFTAAGFAPVLEEPGARTVLQAPDGRRVDLNGLTYRPEGYAVQSDAGGDIELFPGWGWTSRRVGNRHVVCLTAEAQRLKHRGYSTPRPQGAADLQLIDDIDEPAHFDPTVRAMESSEGRSDRRHRDGVGSTPRALRIVAVARLASRSQTGRGGSHHRHARGWTTTVRLCPPGAEWTGHCPHRSSCRCWPRYGRLGIGRALVEAARGVALRLARRPAHHLDHLRRRSVQRSLVSPPRIRGPARTVEPRAGCKYVADESGASAAHAPRVSMGRRLA